MKIGIIGNGFVGRATRIFVKNYFSENDDDERFEVLPNTSTTPVKPSSATATAAAATPPQRPPPPFFKRIFFKPIPIYIYDIRPEACYPPGITLEDLDNECDLLFFCLPTPLNHDGTCYTKILEDMLARCSNPYKIVRSTVPVGFSAKHGCYFMPEFLTEARWENDFRSTKEWIVGMPTGTSATITASNSGSAVSSAAAITDIQRQEFKRRISKLIKRSHKNGAIDSPTVVFCDTNEAEMLKLMKNCFLSAKVGLMNEFYDFSRATNVDYNAVIELAKKDARMGTSHFKVPGPDGLRGFGGTCFPKDTHSLYCQMNAHGTLPYIFPAVLSRNDTRDRAAREWSKDVWRTTIPLPSATSKVVVVFSERDTEDMSLSQYIKDVIRTNLSNGNVVVEVMRDSSSTTMRDSSSTTTTTVCVPTDKNHLIKRYQSKGTPLFFPRVDECYYTPDSNNTAYDTMREVSSIIDLWNSHEEMILYIVKQTRRNESMDSESGTEGFDSDAESGTTHHDWFDYAKVIEEYYHKKYNDKHSLRRLVVMF